MEYRDVLSREQAGLLRCEVMDVMQIIGLEPCKLKQTWQYLSDSAIDHFVHSEVMRGLASSLTGSPATLYMPFTAVKTGHEDGDAHRKIKWGAW